nr:redoxin domain-containing protein [Deltaproteobacteria bacterium]
MSMHIGKKAPDFSGEAFHLGQTRIVRISDYHGKWVLLFFYPADFTSV